MRYLGDGVQVRRDNGSVVLETTNGVDVTNRIYLEPEVLALLFEFLAEPAS